eukprot:gene17468-19905_t
MAERLDTRAVTTGMFRLLKYREPEAALDLFEKVLLPRNDADVVAYSAAIRAAIAYRPLTYSINLFSQCRAQHGFKVIEVIDAALCGLASGRNGSSTQSLEYAEAYYHWLISNSLRPTINILNQLLRIACVHGTDTEVETILKRIKVHGFSLDGHSYNTLLCRYATKGDQSNALQVLRQIHTAGYRADQYTYNQLLKLYMVINNQSEAEKVLAAMRRHPNITIDAKAQYYLNKLYAAHNLPHLAPQSVTTDGHSHSAHNASTTLNPILGTAEWYSQAIRSSVNANSTISLLQQSQQQQCASDRVYEAAFSMCVQKEEFSGAYAVFDMWAREKDISAVFSTLTAGFVLLQNESVKRSHFYAPLISRIAEYVSFLSTNQSALLTERVWMLIVTELCRADRSILAANLLSEALLQGAPAREVHAGVLTTLIETLQKAQNTLLETSPTLPVFERDLQGALYGEAAFKVIKAMRIGFSTRPELLPVLMTHHFNMALEMLSRSKLYGQVRDLFHIVRRAGGVEVNTATNRRTDPVHCIPSTFTVAEIVRCARALGDMQLACGALVWGMDNLVYLPPGIISDALSLMYSEGQREAVAVLYRELYKRGHITHWAVSSPRRGSRITPVTTKSLNYLSEMAVPTSLASHVDSVKGGLVAPVSSQQQQGGGKELLMDLHGFSRGMAYAALHVAIEEIKSDAASHIRKKQLIIITGSGASQPDAYRLSDAVQEVLTEDFYPPIASSTVPRNTGRNSMSSCDFLCYSFLSYSHTTATAEGNPSLTGQEPKELTEGIGNFDCSLFCKQRSKGGLQIIYSTF